MKITNETVKGQRPYQEDRYIREEFLEGTLLGVFDGHGGSEVAQIASEDFAVRFRTALVYHSAKEAMEVSVAYVNRRTQHMYAGSTLSVVFIPKDESVAVCAVLGDSPIIIKDAEGKINISPEHNVRTNAAEAAAAVARGGLIQGGYLFQGFNNDGLQMARALGDSSLSEVLSRVPDIYEVPLGINSFVLVATDGAFDPSHRSFVAEMNKIMEAIENGADAKTLVSRALAVPTGDNVTCILARLEAK